MRDGFLFKKLAKLSSAISEARAESFDFRMRNEDMLLDKANLRPWFGWGTWGRNRIYDPRSGKDLSVTDGRWIQVIGSFGWIGLIAEFGLLALPVFSCVKTLRYIKSRREAVIMAAVTLLLGINVLDLLPNNTMTPWTWLMAGALLGRTQQIAVERRIARKLKTHGSLVPQPM